jgi:hypothetical protein
MDNNESTVNLGNTIKQSLLKMAFATPLGMIAFPQTAVSDIKKRAEDAFMVAWQHNPDNMRDPRACGAGQAMAMLLPVGNSLISYASGYAPACQVVGDDLPKPTALPFARNQALRAMHKF